MKMITQIQAVREGEATTIYALDTEGQLWRGQRELQCARQFPGWCYHRDLDGHRRSREQHDLRPKGHRNDPQFHCGQLQWNSNRSRQNRLVHRRAETEFA